MSIALALGSQGERRGPRRAHPVASFRAHTTPLHRSPAWPPSGSGRSSGRGSYNSDHTEQDQSVKDTTVMPQWLKSRHIPPGRKSGTRDVHGLSLHQCRRSTEPMQGGGHHHGDRWEDTGAQHALSACEHNMSRSTEGDQQQTSGFRFWLHNLRAMRGNSPTLGICIINNLLYCRKNLKKFIKISTVEQK